MSYAYHKGIVQAVGQVKLLQCYLTAFLYLGLVFAILCVLNLIGCTCSSSLKLHLNTQVPVLVELVVTGYHKAGNRDGVTLEVTIALSRSVEPVDTIVLELSQNLAIAANAISCIAVHLGRIVVPLSVGYSD